MALYIPHSIFHLARLSYVRPETFGPYCVSAIFIIIKRCNSSALGSVTLCWEECRIQKSETSSMLLYVWSSYLVYYIWCTVCLYKLLRSAFSVSYFMLYRSEGFPKHFVVTISLNQSRRIWDISLKRDKKLMNAWFQASASKNVRTSLF